MSAMMAEPQTEEAPLAAVFEAPAYVAPHVNLLPPEITARRVLRKLQAGLAAGVIACAAIVGVLYVQAGSGKSEAQSRLDAATAQQAVLQAQTAKLAYVSAAKATIDAARASLKAAMGSEVLWSKTLDDLRSRLPDGVRYQSITVVAVPTPVAGAVVAPAATTPGAAAALPTDALATATFTGSANNLDDVAAELDQLALVPGVSNVYLTSTTAKAASGSTAPQIVNFVATADLTNTLLSHRYDNLTGGSQ